MNTEQPRGPCVPSAPHGTLRGWSLGCRCLFCQSAKTATVTVAVGDGAGTGDAADHAGTQIIRSAQVPGRSPVEPSPVVLPAAGRFLPVRTPRRWHGELSTLRW